MNTIDANVALQANTPTPKKKYDDPLNRFPLSALSYSNNVGVLISDFAPRLGRLLWAPAFMYYGADIYDKFKNDKDTYNPSAKRGVKRVIFQGFTNFLFPIFTVGIGKKAASALGFLNKDKLSLSLKEFVLNHHYKYMSHMRLGETSAEVYKKQYCKVLNNYVDESLRKKHALYSFKKLFKSKELETKIRNDISNFANKTIDQMYRLREQLLNNEKPANMSDKMFKKFQNLKKIYKSEYPYGDNAVMAVKDILKDIQIDKINKLKFFKMLGGLSVMLLLANPVYIFVKKVLMNKIFNPSVDKFINGDVYLFKKIMNSNNDAPAIVEK